jgi:hypothetical protein
MNKKNQVLSQVANEAVTKEHIISYLNVVRNNPNLSVLNQAMIYLQKPAAKMVCGKKAWENIGRTVKENARPIVLFFPSIHIAEAPENISTNEKEPVYCNDYIPVNAFDLDSTDGNIISDAAPKHEPFADIIVDVIETSIEETTLTGNDKVKGYKFEKENKVFYISDACKSDSERNRILMDIYLDYIFDSYQITDKCLKAAIKYVMGEHYGFMHNIAEPAFSKLNQKTEEEKLTFLYWLQYFTSNIIQDFEGYHLTFDETAFVNDLLHVSDISKICVICDKSTFSIEDELLKDELQNMKSKLLRTTDDCLQHLLELREKQEVYSFPPYELQLDKTDYLKEERVKLLQAAELNPLSEGIEQVN